MPLFEYRCSDCREVTERFFFSFGDSEVPIECGCGGLLAKLVSRVTFNAFQPFTTNHIVPDGSKIEVRSRNQLNDLMKRYNLRESRTNHMQYGGDVRSIPLSGEPTGSSRAKRRPAKVGKFTPREAGRVSEDAARSNYGMG